MTMPAPGDRACTPLLAGHTIEEMLGALRQAATNEAMGLEVLEIEAAAQPHPVIERTVSDVRRLGAALGAAHALLLALEPHEAAVRALLGGQPT